MAAKYNFGQDEAASLVENNLIVTIGVPVIEQSFEHAARSMFELGEDWSLNVLRVVLCLVAFNLVKVWTLYVRNNDGDTPLRQEIRKWWHRLFG